MGLDEVLLEAADTRPILRLYTWEPAALSLGYFQRFEDVPAAREVTHVVRRITGGGAIHHHAGELTFSIAAPATDPLYRGEVAASYARVHAVLIEALVAVGLVGEHTPTLAASRGALHSDVAGTGMCFHASTPLDVVWDGRKGIGSAQRRTGGRVLHHGSIKLSPSPYEPEVATATGAGVHLTPREFAPTLSAAFTRALGVTFEREPPTAAELARAESLGARYAAPDFVHRR
jgi:lipoate-protein ligase A